MTPIAQGIPAWLTDVRTLIDLGIVLATGFSGFVGYRVHMLIFNMHLTDRLTALETKQEDHESRIDKLEKKVFGV